MINRTFGCKLSFSKISFNQSLFHIILDGGKHLAKLVQGEFAVAIHIQLGKEKNYPAVIKSVSNSKDFYQKSFSEFELLLSHGDFSLKNVNWREMSRERRFCSFEILQNFDRVPKLDF